MNVQYSAGGTLDKETNTIHSDCKAVRFIRTPQGKLVFMYMVAEMESDKFAVVYARKEMN